MNKSNINLEPRLVEYLKRKQFYEENDINSPIGLEKQYSITKDDIEKIKKIRAKQNIEVDSESESEPEDFEKQYMHNKRKNLKTKVNFEDDPKNPIHRGDGWSITFNTARKNLTGSTKILPYIIFDDSVEDYDEILNSDDYSWDVKKILAKFNKFKLPKNKKLYLTKDDSTIVVLEIGKDNLKVDLYKESDSFNDIDINKNTATKYLADYPEIDTIPFKVLLKLAAKEAVSQDLIRTVINKAKEDTDSAMIVKDLEDGSSLLIDTNAFEAYKITGNNISSIPFTDEAVQSVLTGESENSGALNNLLEPFKNQTRIPDSISKSTILSLIKNLPAESRIFDSAQTRTKAIVIPAENENDSIVFKIIYLNKDIFNNRIVEEGFRKAFKGNWGSEEHTKRLGAVQDLNRLSWYTFISHLRKINLPMDSTAKVVGPRLLNSSQWGFIDPLDTPEATIGREG